MRICSIASSSSGNCIYVGTDHTHILIDAGISGKRIKAALETIGVDPSDINAIVITHEHSDHIRGLGVMARKYHIPIYTTKPTWRKIELSGITGIIDETLFSPIAPGIDFTINELLIHPFSTSHDAVQPVSYTFTHNEKKISVVTDLGCYDQLVVDKVKDSNILFIEANHDVEMLASGSYPRYLKQRILSDRGHLCNEMSGKLVSEALSSNLKYVVLAHLSRENNHPDLAHAAVCTVLERERGVSFSDLQVLVSEKEEMSCLITI